MASNSRNRRSSSRRPTENPPPEPEQAEELSVELPEGATSFAEEEGYEPGEAAAGEVATFEEVAPAGEAGSDEASELKEDSGRRSSSRGRGRSSRSSRRLSASSGRSSRRAALSPEERSARRQALKSALILAFGLMLVIGGGFAAWFFLGRPDPKTAQGLSKLSDLENQDIKRIESALDNQKPSDAEKAMLSARAKIDDVVKLDRPQDLGPALEADKNKLGELDQRIPARSSMTCRCR